MLKAVLFDLDHTLYDREETLRRLAPAFAAHFQARFRGQIDMSVLAESLVRSDKLNYAGWPAVYREMAEGLPWDAPEFKEYEAFMNANLGLHALPYPETDAVLKWCRGRGYKIGMVTNGIVSLQNDKIDTLGIRKYFDAIVISAEFGAHKPDPAIFRHGLEWLGVAPGEAVFVGDNPANDILPAAALGMATIWLDHFSAWPQGIERPGYVAHRLEDVVGILAAVERQ